MSKFERVTGGVETAIGVLMSAQRMGGADVRLLGAESLAPGDFDARASTMGARVTSARTLLWSSRARASLRLAAADIKPDVLHFHSVYHQLSPSVLAVGREMGIPTVLTLHDSKLVAPCYVLTRDGRFCDDCVGRRVPLPAVRHRCIQGSLVASSLCLLEQAAHQRRYASEVDAITVPSRSAAAMIARAPVALPPLHVLPWALDDTSEQADPASSSTVLFVGRLAAEKGLPHLLDAWGRRAPGAGLDRLEIVGDGPLRSLVADAAARDSSIAWRGWLAPIDLARVYATAAVVAIPSVMPETFGLVAVEAMRAGVPVLASDLGALAELVDAGVGRLVPTGDSEALASALDHLTDPDIRRSLGEAARSRFEERYTLERLAQAVADVYSSLRS